MSKNPTPPSQPERANGGIRLSRFAFALLVLVNAGLIVALLWFAQGGSPQAATIASPTAETATATLTRVPPTTEPTAAQDVIVVTATPNPLAQQTIPGLLVFARGEFGYTHLFAYHPEVQPMLRLTGGEWDDMHPALSPDGSQVAFISNRNGSWDIYVLDLPSGAVIQITDDLDYDGHPTWGPDGYWLAYEKYVVEDLEIFIQPIDQPEAALQITDNNFSDFEPSWSADGRLIAFTSNMAGSNDIWLIDVADVENPEAQVNFTSNRTVDQHSAQFASSGRQLAWVEDRDGVQSIYVADTSAGAQSARYVGSGSQAAWAPDNSALAAIIAQPNQLLLGSYASDNGSLVFPPIALDSSVHGLTWGPHGLPTTLPHSLSVNARVTPTVSWAGQLTPSPGNLYGRQFTIELPDVTAPVPALNALVVEPFFALRTHTETALGWDVLSNLDNLYVPLTEPLAPGYPINWLYTGRAFALNTALERLDWIYVVKETYGNQTYWRVFIKTAFQDGSQGQPMTARPWNFQARFSGDTTAYENGGKLFDTIPPGYYVDFTTLALQFGWERQAAQSNWQSFQEGAHHNVFVLTNGLDFESAMLQLYPPEIFERP